MLNSAKMVKHLFNFLQIQLFNDQNFNFAVSFKTLYLYLFFIYTETF